MEKKITTLKDVLDEIIGSNDKFQTIKTTEYEWSKSIEELLSKHYPRYELSNLRLIFIYSHTYQHYESVESLSLVSSGRVSDGTFVSYNTEQFIELINESLGLDRNNTRYDYSCKHAKDQVLFMRINLQAENSFNELSIQFINKILENTTSQKIAILNLKLGKSLEITNLKNLGQEYISIDSFAYKINKLKILNNLGIPIERLFIYGRKKDIENITKYREIVYDIESGNNFNLRDFTFFRDELNTLLSCGDFTSYHQQKGATEEELKSFKLEQWSIDIGKYIESNCLFELSKLRTIVLGSVGFKNFSTTTAFVAEDFGTRCLNSAVPNSAKYFADTLDDINYQNGFDQKYTDYHAQHAREHGGFLFLNTCLSVCLNEAVASVCSVEFINQILAKTKARGQRLAVLDMRLTRYISDSELNTQLEQDTTYSEFCYDGDAYRLVNPTDGEGKPFHRIVRLGNPAFWSGCSRETMYIKDCIKALMSEGYEINCIYLAKCEYNTAKLKKNQTNDYSSMSKNEVTQSIEPIEKLNLLLKNSLKTQTDKLPLEIVLRVLLAFSSKYKWNFVLEKFYSIDLYVERNSLSKSSVCDCFYFCSHTFVVFDNMEKVALVFRSDSKHKENVKIEFMGVTIQYQKRHSQFALSQPALLELIEKINQENFDATSIDPLMAAFVDISRKTRSDICSVVDFLSSYLKENPNNPPIDEIRDLISYLTSTKDSHLTIDGNEWLCGYLSSSFIIPKHKNSIDPTVASSNQTRQPNSSSQTCNKQTNKNVTKIDQNRTQLGNVIYLFGAPVAWSSEKCSKYQDSATLELAAQVQTIKLQGQINALKKEITSESDQFAQSVHFKNFVSNHNNIKTENVPTKVERSTADCKYFADQYHRAERLDINTRLIRAKNNPARHFVDQMHLNKSTKTNENNADIRDTVGLTDPVKNYYP